MNDQGPIIDWVKQFLAGLWDMLARLAELMRAALDRVEARVSHLEHGVIGAFVLLLVAIVVHGLVTRPKK